MAGNEHADPVQFRQTMQGIQLFGLQRNRELLQDDPPAIGPAIDQLQRFMVDNGLLQMGADASTLIDISLLDSIKR